MKKISMLLFLVVLGLGASAQIKDPVSFKYEAVKKVGNTYELVITATVPSPWHIYSQNTGKNGPIPTSISFKKNPLLTLVGKPKELGKLEKMFDKNFNTNVLYFADQVQFVQTITVKGTIKTNISGSVNYMVCDDSQCLPPTTKSFDIKLQ